MYNDTYYNNDYLQHYGVPGMKWGVRRASKLQSKADVARTSASKWEAKAAKYTAKGRTKKAAKYTAKAEADRAVADKYQQKANKKVEKRYAKAGRLAGEAAYNRDKGDKAYESHQKNAKALDAMAKKYDKSGKIAKAELARRSADALRARGENVRAQYYETADSYLKRSDKLNKKASEFATTTNINIGKKKINSIITDSKQKGYDGAKAVDEFRKESAIESALGSKGYSVYNTIRGK